MNQGNSKISAVIIARNEQSRIVKCLSNLKWVEEIIVVDNGSTDDTVNLAIKSGAVVYTKSGNNFSNLRNIGKEKSKYDWLLYIDADETVTDNLKNEIIGIINSYNPDRSASAYYIKRKNYYLGYLWPYEDKMQRLFFKPKLQHWQGQLHETPLYQGSTGLLKYPLIHDTHRSLEEMLNKTNEWSDIEAHLRLKANHPRIVGWRLIRVMWTGFKRSFFDQGGWRAGTVGWIESIYQGFSMFITYAKLWEMQNKKSV